MEFFAECWSAPESCEIDETIRQLRARLGADTRVRSVRLWLHEGWAMVDIGATKILDLAQARELGLIAQECAQQRALWLSLTPQLVSFVLGAKVEPGVGFDEALEHELAPWLSRGVELEKMPARWA